QQSQMLQLVLIPLLLLLAPQQAAPPQPSAILFALTEFVAAAVRSHFDDCPDSHQHFCFHGTCRFLILEETPACVCHPGFVGMRCEHADLLAVVATNHRKQAVATVLVLCVIGCVLIMVLFICVFCAIFDNTIFIYLSVV
uniref:Transforming growth factor, alpha n=1 Tax=Xiphophorus couchianus TaxID=32473 RepID=A0A3B5LLN0_9TELE